MEISAHAWTHAWLKYNILWATCASSEVQRQYFCFAVLPSSPFLCPFPLIVPFHSLLIMLLSIIKIFMWSANAEVKSTGIFMPIAHVTLAHESPWSRHLLPHAKRLCKQAARNTESAALIYWVTHAIDGQDQHSARLSTNMLLRLDKTLLQVALSQGWTSEPPLQPGAGWALVLSYPL